MSSVLDELAALVAENPDRRNDRVDTGVGFGCAYVRPDGRPACVIGHLADRLGWPLPPYDDNYHNTCDIEELWAEELDTEDLATKLVLYRVQEGADEGLTWSEALSCASREDQA